MTDFDDRRRIIEIPFPLTPVDIAVLRIPVPLSRVDADRLCAGIAALVDERIGGDE